LERKELLRLAGLAYRLQSEIEALGARDTSRMSVEERVEADLAYNLAFSKYYEAKKQYELALALAAKEALDEK